jgi:hypothetical protein
MRLAPPLGLAAALAVAASPSRAAPPARAPAAAPTPSLVAGIADPSFVALFSADGPRRARPSERATLHGERGGPPLAATMTWGDDVWQVLDEQADAVRATFQLDGATVIAWVPRAELRDVIVGATGLAATSTAPVAVAGGVGVFVRAGFLPALGGAGRGRRAIEIAGDDVLARGWVPTAAIGKVYSEGDADMDPLGADWHLIGLFADDEHEREPIDVRDRPGGRVLATVRGGVAHGRPGPRHTTEVVVVAGPGSTVIVHGFVAGDHPALDEEGGGYGYGILGRRGLVGLDPDEIPSGTCLYGARAGALAGMVWESGKSATFDGDGWAPVTLHEGGGALTAWVHRDPDHRFDRCEGLR